MGRILFGFIVGFAVAWTVFDPAGFGNMIESTGDKVGEFGKGFSEGAVEGRPDLYKGIQK